MQLSHSLSHKLFICCFLLIISIPQGWAQKVLQLEKGGSHKTTKIHIGETIIFQLKDDDTGWYERVIFDIQPNSGYLNLEGVQIHVDSIAKLKFDKRPVVPNIIGSALQAGGINMIIFDVSRGLVWDKDKGINGPTLISGAANIAVGTLLKKIFNAKKFKVTKRKRLRLLDLDFGKPFIPIT